MGKKKFWNQVASAHMCININLLFGVTHSSRKWQFSVSDLHHQVSLPPNKACIDCPSWASGLMSLYGTEESAQPPPGPPPHFYCSTPTLSLQSTAVAKWRDDFTDPSLVTFEGLFRIMRRFVQVCILHMLYFLLCVFDFASYCFCVLLCVCREHRMNPYPFPFF